MKVVEKRMTMLTLASLAKTAKRFALDTSVSDEEFLNALLEPLVVAGRIKGRGGIDFHLDKSRTSQILNGRCDVPGALRKALARYGIEESVENEFSGFVDEFIDASLFHPFADEVISLMPNGAEASCRMQNASDDEELFMAIALLEAVKNDNRESSEELLWSNGTGSLSIEIGDLFSHGFGKPRKVKQIVVIPVDTTFETRITWQYENTAKPLVSPKSLHGKWLARMAQTGVSTEELDDRIESSLRRRSIAASGSRKNESCERAEYPIGTVAVIENARSLFYLLAISRFDENNNTQSTREDIAKSIQALLSTYDAIGQGFDVYVPLMGTGESRAGLSHQESLDLIANEMASEKALIHGRVTIIVYREDASKLEISAKED